MTDKPLTPEEMEYLKKKYSKKHYCRFCGEPFRLVFSLWQHEHTCLKNNMKKYKKNKDFELNMEREEVFSVGSRFKGVK